VAVAVTLAVAGTEFTDAGATLKLPVPDFREQIRVTVELNPN
jgi:hypothetical protein